MPKCKKCGFRARDIAGLARHYRKKHPGAMKRKKSKASVRSSYTTKTSGMNYCPCCGKEL